MKALTLKVLSVIILLMVVLLIFAFGMFVGSTFPEYRIWYGVLAVALLIMLLSGGVGYYIGSAQKKMNKRD